MDAQLSLRRLEVFRLVVDQGSVTRAAELLMVAQPAVSSQLRALESWCGAKLFERHGNRLVLTEAGQRVDTWAHEVLAGAAQIRRDVTELATGMGGGAVVWASMAVGTYLLPPVLTQLRDARPAVDLTLNISQPAEAVRAVESGEADFAVVSWDHRALPDQVSAEFLRTEPLHLYMTPSTAPTNLSMTADTAMALPLVGAPRQVAYADLLAQMRAATDVEPNFVVRLGHIEAIKRAAIDHNWALFSPDYAVQLEVAAGLLIRVEVPDLSTEEHLVLLARRDRFFSPLQQAALDAVRDVLHA